VGATPPTRHDAGHHPGEGSPSWGGAPAGAGRRRLQVRAYGLVLAGGGEWDCRQEASFCRLWRYLRDRVETPPFLGIRGMAACP